MRVVGRSVVRLPGPWSLHRYHRHVADIKVARPSIFIGTPSIFESLILKQIDLYCKTIMTHGLHFFGAIGEFTLLGCPLQSF